MRNNCLLPLDYDGQEKGDKRGEPYSHLEFLPGDLYWTIYWTFTGPRYEGWEPKQLDLSAGETEMRGVCGEHEQRRGFTEKEVQK